MIPIEFTFRQFQTVIRKKLSLPKTAAFYIFFSNNKLYANGKLFTQKSIINLEKSIKQIYEEARDQDGFLYCKYSSENFTGEQPT